MGALESCARRLLQAFTMAAGASLTSVRLFVAHHTPLSPFLRSHATVSLSGRVCLRQQAAAVGHAATGAAQGCARHYGGPPACGGGRRGCLGNDVGQADRTKAASRLLFQQGARVGVADMQGSGHLGRWKGGGLRGAVTRGWQGRVVRSRPPGRASHLGRRGPGRLS